MHRKAAAAPAEELAAQSLGDSVLADEEPEQGVSGTETGTAAEPTRLRQLALQALVEHENQANVALTRVFANSLWPHYSSFVNSAFGVPKTELPQRPEIIQLREDILRQMKGLKVVFHQ